MPITPSLAPSINVALAEEDAVPDSPYLAFQALTIASSISPILVPAVRVQLPSEV